MRFRLFRVVYKPHPEERAFLQRLEIQEDGEFVVRGSVLDDRESERFFGVPMAHKGLQPLWLQITSKSKLPYPLRLASLDPNYYPPLEAAYVCHFAIGKRLLGFGLLAWLFLPLLIVLLFKVLSARSARLHGGGFPMQPDRRRLLHQRLARAGGLFGKPDRAGVCQLGGTEKDAP